MMRAAPKATLAWMKEQARQDHPRISQLILIWQTWGFWARVGHERQYTAELDEVAGELNASAAIDNDPLALPALLRFAGEVHSKRMEGAVLNCMTGFTPTVRAEAASACGRLGSDACADALIKSARREDDPAVQQKIAMAAEVWPDRPEMGAAPMDLFNRTSSAAVRARNFVLLLQGQLAQSRRLAAAGL